VNGELNPNDSHLTEGVYKAPSSFLPPGPKVFQPWHKPRKQYIRKYQWGKEVRELIERIDFRDDRPLKYLGLPGEDMFDIRCLSDICLEHGLTLEYLGFNTSNSNQRSSDQTISENELIHISNIHKESRTVIDFIQSLADKNSIAYTTMNDMGPFDIVNLDLCTSVAQKTKEENTGSYRFFDAIYEILNFQTKTRIQPWLLFLTTRGEKDEQNQDDLNKLWSCVYSNLHDNDGFRGKLEALIGTSMKEYETIDDIELEVYKFAQLFSIGVGKWLLETMMSAEPRCSVQMLDSYCYRVAHSKPNLISTAFIFCPQTQAPKNVASLAKQTSEESIKINVKDLECSLVDVVAHIKDVDVLLHHDAGILSQMIYESKELLKLARYNVDDYDKWEQSNRPKIG
jgi:hypothetical protein